MLPAANLHLRGLYDSTVEFFALRTPSLSPRLRPTDTSDANYSGVSSRSLTPVPDPIAKLTRECSSLRERLDAVDSRHSTCTSSSLSGLTLPSMRRELDDTKKELARTRMEMAKLEERCKRLEKALKETKQLLKKRDVEMQSLKGAPDVEVVADDRDDELTSGSRRSGEESDEDRAKRKSDEEFMTRTDNWSGAQVVQAVHDLNSEILQFSAAATELCTFERRSQPSSSTKFIQATHDTSARLGQNVARILSSRDHSQDPILVQLALQGCLSTCIARALSSFCLGFPSKHDSILSQIYSHMYTSVPQPTSSRWRALTHQHIHKMYPYLVDYSINELAETIYRWSADVFLISGCTTTGRSSFSSRDGLRTRFGDQVLRLSRTVVKLAQVTREEIMSTNFDIIAVEPGESFDSHKMCDAFGEFSKSRGDILATTELGLRCAMKTGKDSRQEEDRRLLMRPKVVLDSVLDFMEPR